MTLRRNVEDLQAVALQPARAARRFVDRPFDRAVRQALGDAGRAWAGWPFGPLCPARRSAGGEGRRGSGRAVRAVDRSAPARSTKSRARRRLWFQLYIVKDRGFVSDMIARAKEARLRRAAAHRRPAGARHTLSRLSRGHVGRDARRGRRAWQVLAAPRLGVGRRACAAGR